MAGDSNFDSVVLHLPFDGPNLGTDIRDRSNSRKAVTVVGGAKISTTDSIFGGASLALDGAGDYLTLADSADWNFGSAAFTIEGWFKRASASGTMFLSSQVTSVGGGNYNGHQLSLTATALSFTGYSTNPGVSRSLAHTADTNWHHFCICSDGTNIYLGVDGAVSSFAAVSVGDSAQTLAIGIDWDRTSSAFNGYLDDIRITKGVARYTATFTPPTIPNPIGLETVADPYYSNVSLLINADDTLADESLAPKALTAFGNAALTKVDSKVGAGSLVFDGAGDYITTPDNAGWAFGSGDFTIEFWAKFASVPGAGAYAALICQRATIRSNIAFTITYGGSEKWYFSYSTNGTTILDLGGFTTETPTANTWNHIAYVKAGASVDLYVSGAKQTTKSIGTASLFDSTAPLLIGAANSTSPASFFNGYLDGIRITKGVARYTSSFTSPNYVLAAQLSPPVQAQLTLTGQTPSLPVSYSDTPAIRQLTLTGLQGSILVGVAATGNVTGRGFTQSPALAMIGIKPDSVTGRGFATSPAAYGGAVVEGRGFASAVIVTLTAAETAYITGRGFASNVDLSLDALFEISVSGRGFSTSPQLFGAAAISGRSFTYSPTITAVAPTSFSIIGRSFTTLPAITAQAINQATITGRGFVSGIAYSQTTGRGFSTSAILKSTFTAEYAEAFVLNLVPANQEENLYSVSRYQNYPFQHITRIANTYYGVKSDGLYQLSGEYDLIEETPVNGTITLNEDDLSAFNSQNIPYIYLNGEDDYSATAVVDDVAQPTFTSGFGGRRVRLARGSKGRYWYFAIAGIKALQGVEYRPEKLTRKVK